MKKYQLNTVELVHSGGFPIGNRPHIYQTIIGPNGPHIYQTIAGRGKKEKKMGKMKDKGNRTLVTKSPKAQLTTMPRNLSHDFAG